MNFLSRQDVTITVAAEPFSTLAALESRWRDLESRADGSFFTTWAWIGAWLSTAHANGQTPKIHTLAAYAGDLLVGLAIIGERESRSLLRPGVIAALHQSGDPDDDAIFVEYNDFLLDRRFAGQTREAMLAFIGRDKARWREFCLSGATPALAGAVTQSGLHHRIISDRVCPWIDLVKAPPGMSGYLAILSRNTRQQIQQSLRLYEAEGPLTLTPAQSARDAAPMLDELHGLHRKSWQDRKGHEGAFGSPRFVRFAERLVSAGIETGQVQLLRASAGQTPVGYLLNFIHRGHVYAYQSGFAYRDDNRFRPGLVCHALAAVQAREQGRRGYHFMAGEGRYKSSLANAEEHLFWMALRRDDLLSRAEDSARALSGRLRGLLHGHAV